MIRLLLICCVLLVALMGGMVLFSQLMVSPAFWEFAAFIAPVVVLLVIAIRAQGKPRGAVTPRDVARMKRRK